MRAGVVAVIGVTGGVACAKHPARTPVAPTAALNVPAPPPRHVVPVSLQPVEPPTVVIDPEPVAPAKPPQPPPATTKPVDRTPPPPVTPPPANNDVPPPVLQTTREPREVEAEARRDLGRAKSTLERVQVARLDAKGKAIYKEAMDWIGQAEEALKVNNFIAARDFASKAVQFADALAKALS